MDADEIWPRCPEAEAFFMRTLRSFAAANPLIEEMEPRFPAGAGVNLNHLVDHWILPSTPERIAELDACGLVWTNVDGEQVWEHPRARLTRVRLSDEGVTRLALAVESVDRFLAANDLTPTSRFGSDEAGYEEARIPLTEGELAVVMRMGTRGFGVDEQDEIEPALVEEIRMALRERDRSGTTSEVIERLRELFTIASERIGRDRAVDEFFAAERDYYMARNRAAQWQYERQQELGFGWANHDHHTYRCSREGFRDLLRLWREMGFEFRERYYAGAEAGWGAQIVEHPVSRVVIFSDVDIASEELDIDFSTRLLPTRDTLGTIGLWCALHGDSIAASGMHHLEAEFDFARAEANLKAAGFGVMAPFTDLPMLKQAFTEAEIWPVASERAQALLAKGVLTSEQAERFVTRGAAGSHLEILQRREGFKGFNKTGVSAIIRDTDARKATH